MGVLSAPLLSQNPRRNFSCSGEAREPVVTSKLISVARGFKASSTTGKYQGQ